MKNYSLPFILFYLLLPFVLTAQVAPKYGKLSQEEKEILKTELDPDADAIILSDYGEIDFMGSEVSFLRHTRIKILNRNGLNEANISIPFLSSDEEITKIKAQTLEIDEKGKVKKSKVKKANFYTIDIGPNIREIRFTFPNVKPGSIIEYEFIKNSNSTINLEEWKFRNHLPTLQSILFVIIAKELDYKIVYNGQKLVDKYGDVSRNVWELKNLEPLRSEPFCLNPADYIESIRFQLAGVKFAPTRRGEKEIYKPIMPTWDQFALDILETNEFTNFLKTTKSSKNIVEKIISDSDSDRDKIHKIYSYIQTSLGWNEQYQVFPEKTFSQIMESRIGGSADINLSLIKLLKTTGIDSNPLIISTKDHGLITQVYPLATQFNHLIVQVKLDGEDFLMDATSKFRPAHLLSKNDLNPLGFLLSKNAPRWIIIEYPSQTKTSIIADLKFTEARMNFKTSFSFHEHNAIFYREKLAEEKDERKFILNHLLSQLTEDDLKLDSFEIRNKIEIEKPLNIIMYSSKKMEGTLNDEILYFNAFIQNHFDKNPFMKTTRFLPIDFILPSQETFILNLFLPTGFELAETPKTKKISTESKKVKYSFLCKTPFPGKVQLISDFKIIDPLILPDEYETLRELFNKMIGLQATQLVLKRK